MLQINILIKKIYYLLKILMKNLLKNYKLEHKIKKVYLLLKVIKDIKEVKIKVFQNFLKHLN